LTNLTAIFDIAQSFFDLNLMKVNHDKSFILTSKTTEVDISIFSKFLNQPVSFPIKKPSESTRYLGVWISANYNKSYIKQQIKDEIADFILKLKYKPLTDKQLKYIFNMVLIPRIEYRSQLVVFSSKECHALFSQVRIFLKHKLKYPKSTPNSILNSKLTNGFNDFVANMIHSKIQHFAIMINGNTSSSLLAKTTEIRLK